MEYRFHQFLSISFRLIDQCRRLCMWEDIFSSWVLKLLRKLLSSWMISANLASFCNGRIETFTGAILGLRTKYVLFSSLTLKVCSNMTDIILPRPNEGSITLGVYFSSFTFTIFCSKLTWSFVSLKSVPLALTVMNWSVSNLLLSSTFWSSVALSKWEIMAWESFLNSLPMTLRSKMTEVWS